MGVTGLPDNFPVQQKERLYCKPIFFILFEKNQLIVEWEDIWQSRDFSLSIELHAQINTYTIE